MKRTLTLDAFKRELFLGSGATSQVFLARDPEGNPVALKIPKREVRENTELAKRFAREVRLSLGIAHPHIVKGLAGKPYGPGAFLALEYFEEGTLGERVKKGNLPRELKLAYLAQIARALKYLHNLGIVHQDVKPANVFIRGKVAKLGDFGVAKTREEPTPLERAGSPFYMAPELFEGQEATPASDAYSFGVMAYEILAGRRPFVGETYEELMTAHLTNRPMPLKDENPALARAIMGLLEKDPGKRATIEDFLEALSSTTGEKKPAVPDQKGTNRKPKKGGFLSRLLGRKS